MNQEDKYHALEDPYIDNWSGYDVAIEMAEEDGHDWSTLSPEKKWIIYIALALIRTDYIDTFEEY